MGDKKTTKSKTKKGMTTMSCLQSGQRFTTVPEEFQTDILTKKRWRWKKQVMFVSEGTMKVYANAKALELSQQTSVIDLGQSSINYKQNDIISIKTDKHTYTFKLHDKNKFQWFIDLVQQHYHYRQDFLRYGAEEETRDENQSKQLTPKDTQSRLYLIRREMTKLVDAMDKIKNNGQSKKSKQKNEVDEANLRNEFLILAREIKRYLNEFIGKFCKANNLVDDEPLVMCYVVYLHNCLIYALFLRVLDEESVLAAGQHRTRLPHAMVPTTTSLFSLISFGKDMTKISFPVDMLEPLGTLQCLCEELEYADLLDKAASDTDPKMRIVYVTAFGVSRYASTLNRGQRKPFVPLEGETYENKRDDLGWWFIAEQVSLGPNVSACVAKGHGWELRQTAYYGVKFRGTSIDVDQKSPVEVVLTELSETYTWNKVTTTAYGIFSSAKYCDHHGQMIVKCDNGHSAKITFKQMSGSSKHEVHGDTYDSENKMVHTLKGHWSKSFYILTNSMEKFNVWTANALPANSAQYYGFTNFCYTLNELNADLKQSLPKTDSRLRPDMRLLEEGKIAEAEKIRKQLELNQTNRRKSQQFTPKWFTKEDKYVFPSNNRYWQSREAKFSNETFVPLW